MINYIFLYIFIAIYKVIDLINDPILENLENSTNLVESSNLNKRKTVDHEKSLKESSEVVFSSLEVLDNLKEKFNDPNCTKQQKIKILTLLPNSWTYTQINEHFPVNRYMFESARKLRTEKGILADNDKKTGNF